VSILFDIFLLYLYELVYILLSLVLESVSMEYIMYCIALIFHSMALSSGYPWMSCVHVGSVHSRDDDIPMSSVHLIEAL